jgi:hypothetical protein
LVFRVVSFLRSFPPKPCTLFYTYSYVYRRPILWWNIKTHRWNAMFHTSIYKIHYLVQYVITEPNYSIIIIIIIIISGSTVLVRTLAASHTEVS